MVRNNLRVLRATKDVKQKDIAEYLGITLSTYCRKEKGKVDFTLNEANKISKYFNETIEKIFFEN